MSIYSKNFGPQSYQEPNTSIYKILKEIKPTDKKILDIGCSSGYLDSLIKKQHPAEITGIEIDPKDAKKAKEFVDHIIVGNVESFNFDKLKTKYDLIILADILEHLVNPGNLLDKLHQVLKPDGRIVVSLPNFHHYSIKIRVMANNWHYDDCGLLDQSHLRFFTYDTMIKFFLDHRFYVEKLDFVTSPVNFKTLPHDLVKNHLSPTLAFSKSIFPSESFVFQYLITLSPKQFSKYPNYLISKKELLPEYSHFSLKSLAYLLYLKFKSRFTTI